MKTPVFDALKNLMKENSVSFHMPGHKGKNTSFNWGDYIPMIDTTETFGMDNLLDPEGIILESQKETARIFGAKYTQYCPNGSTGSIYIALSAITKPGDTVIVQRNCHKSVYNSMILNRLDPIYVFPNYNEKYKVLTGVDPAEIERLLSENPQTKAVVITHPNYYGVVSNLPEIAKIVHAHGKVLMVDEAHGPHMGFSKNLPPSALSCGADIVIQSVHKTLPSLTSTSYIHVGTDRIDLNKLMDRFQLYITTSPSYLLTTSCEMAAAYMDTDEAKERLEKNIALCNKTIERLNNIDKVFCFTGDPEDKTIMAKDNTKMLFKIKNMKGTTLKKLLYKDFNIRLEMTDYYYALALSSLMNDEEDYDRLVDAANELSKRNIVEEIANVEVNLDEPNNVRPISDSYMGKKELVYLKDSVGRISATSIIPYPPGVPLIVPGEVITKELYEEIVFLQENEITIVGMMGEKDDQLVVVE
ncbi:MAG: aminotransferase class I/II-fold pyridoxal phosphate-dependent enzyme [Tissierellia bacterium]|nr:aminotransferase class I/II-fold pyridoxal phosphate-dependent enzyme [Tissierellia bacterium]